MNAFDYLDRAYTVQSTDSLSKAIAALRQNGYGLVVLSGSTIKGVLDDRALLAFEGDAGKAKAGSFAVKTPLVEADAPLAGIIAQFLSSGRTLFPAAEHGKLKGAFLRLSALRMLEESTGLRGLTVRDVMTAPAATVAHNENLAKVRNRMLDSGVYRFVVLDEKNKPAGILSAFDIITKAEPQAKTGYRNTTFTSSPRKNLTDIPVSAVMTSPFESIAPGDSLQAAAAKLIRLRLRALPVLDGDRLVGLIHARNFYEAFAAPRPLNIDVTGLRDDEHALKESILEEASAWLEKLEKHLKLSPEDRLRLRIRSAQEGQKRRYEVNAHLTVKGRLYALKEKASDEHRAVWDVSMAVREALDELEKLVLHSEGRSNVRERERRTEEE